MFHSEKVLAPCILPRYLFLRAQRAHCAYRRVESEAGAESGAGVESGAGAESEAGAKSGAGVESEEEQQEEEVEEEDLIPKRRSSCDVLSNDTLTWKQIALT